MFSQTKISSLIIKKPHAGHVGARQIPGMIPHGIFGHIGGVMAPRDVAVTPEILVNVTAVIGIPPLPHNFAAALGAGPQHHDLTIVHRKMGVVGKGLEKGIVSKCDNPKFDLPVGKEVVNVDPRYFRPTEVDLLIGDPTKIKTTLGWEPKYDLKGLVSDMVKSDIKNVQKDKYLKEGGYKIMNYFE